MGELELKQKIGGPFPRKSRQQTSRRTWAYEILSKGDVRLRTFRVLPRQNNANEKRIK